MSVQINKYSLIRSVCRDSYAEFLRHFWSASCSDPLDWNWHLEYVANFIQEHVERLMRGEPAKGPLVCNQPPGSSKTTLFSIMLAPWIWTRMPGCCVVGASYSQDVALLHGMKCRDVIRSELYQKCFPEVQVRDDSDKKSQFMTTAGGIRRSIGVGTNITGEHFHCLPYESLVETADGPIPIGYIVDNDIKVDILAYDHEQETVRLQPIMAYETFPGRILDRFVFSDGSVLELTQDHPIYVVGRGYVWPSQVGPGDTVIYGNMDNRCLRNLQQGIRHTGNGPSQTTQEQPIWESVLFSPMPESCFAEQENNYLRDMQKAVQSSKMQVGKFPLLQRRLQEYRSGGREQCFLDEASDSSLSCLREKIRDAAGRCGGDSEVLFLEMSKSGAFRSHERSGQFQLHSRASGLAVYPSIFPETREDQEARRLLLLSMRQNRGSDRAATFDSSCGLRQAEQQVHEPRRVMSPVSCPDARADSLQVILGTKTVKDVIRAVRLPGKVYNLRISQDHNYFANRTLVHNCLVADDPIDPIASLSNAELNQVNYWMKNVYAQRVKNKMTALHMLVMQRLAQGDPTAEFLQKKNVQHLCLPASTEFPIYPAELAAKYADGLLDPKRIPRTYLEHIRSPKELGETGYAAQFGQTPIPLSGGRFDVGKLRWGVQPQEFKRVCRAWDKAVTPQKGAGVIGRQPDWTVGTLLGIDMEDRVWVLDVVRMRVDSFRREAMIQRTAERDGVGVTIAVEKEPGAGGVESAEATARRLVGYRVKLIGVSGSKESRADAFSYAVNAGIVFLPAKMREGNRWVGWAQDWVEEFSYFPTGRFDDQVDSASTAYNLIARKKIEVGALL